MTDQKRDAKGRLLPIHGVEGVLAGPGKLTLSEVERMNLTELRAGIRNDPEVRELLKAELTARLAQAMRFGFAELERLADAGLDPWNAPVASKLGTYLALLERMLRSYPKGDKQVVTDELKRIREIVERHESEKETVIESAPVLGTPARSEAE